MKTSGTLLATAAIFFLAALSALAQKPMEYTLRFPAPETHYVEVEARVPVENSDPIELMMAVWTPGSYMLREYAGQVDGVTAEASGQALAVEKVRKNRWRIGMPPGSRPEQVTVRYRLWCREMSVRTNWVERDFALLNGAATFLTLPPESGSVAAKRSHRVRVELPAEWRTVATGLVPAEEPNTWVAPDFDTLVDSPFLAGNPTVHSFQVNGKEHQLVNEGEGGAWDGPKSAADVHKIVEHFASMWGGLPYDRYLFLNVITEAGGGLEHKNSTVLMASRWAMATRKTYVKWLELAAHEYFHVWNVKRLRPVDLGPFDYENEVYTRSLWFAEGVTDYYGTIGVTRAGLSTPQEGLASLSESIQNVQTSPGRLVQPVADASFDAWIKYYRRNPNSANTTTSYYTKGTAIAFLLDAKIRQVTAGKRSLDDVMRVAYDRYSGDRGYTEDEIRRTISEVAGADLSAWLGRAVDTAEELDFAEALSYYGLRFKLPTVKDDQPGYLGVRTRTSDGRLVISEVRRGTPAFEAGLNVDDEILAINDYRVPADGLTKRLEAYRPKEQVELLIARRERLMRIPVTLGAAPLETWELEQDPKATAVQKKHFNAWLHRKTE